MADPILYPSFIDFEASGLGPESYPIEVAWNGEGGSVESYLINIQAVPDWTYWDPNAERDAHHISQDHLFTLGDPPSVVAKRMNTALNGRTLYCDAPDFDGFWLKRLFDAVGLTPTFILGSAIDLFDDIITHNLPAPDKSAFAIQARYDHLMESFGLEAWENIGFRPHRASHDVQHLMETYRLLKASNGILPPIG